MTTTDAIEEELPVGIRGTFAAAGFREVSRPTLRRVMMRIDFWQRGESLRRLGMSTLLGVPLTRSSFRNA